MSLSIAEWVQRLSKLDLPVFRSTASGLARLSPRQDRISSGEIDDVILLDPLMTLKVLRHVNRARRSRLSSQITTVEHAVMMLGVYPFFNLFTVNPVVEDYFQDKPDALNHLRVLSCRAQHGAYQARDWALLRQDIESEEVYVAALLCNMVEMLLLCAEPDSILQMNAMIANGTAREVAQKNLFGFELKELQATLVSEWRISEILEDMMLPDASVKPRLMSVSVACEMARDAEQGWYKESMFNHIDKIANLLHRPVDEMTSRIHHIAVIAARHSGIYETTPAAAGLPIVPPMQVESSQAEGSPATCPGAAFQPSKVQEVIDQIEAHLDASLSLNEMLSLVLNGLHDGVGLYRVVFANLSRDHKMLMARHIIGGDQDPSFKNFQIGMDGKHLFRYLLSKQQAVWLNDGNRQQIQPLVTEEIRGIIGNHDFFAMSAFVKGKPVGLFYGDCGETKNCVLDDAKYQAFKKLCLKACDGLAHLAVKQ